MGAEFIVGAGLKATISSLAASDLPGSNEILNYISDWFSQDEAEKWQGNWETDMASNITNYEKTEAP